MRAASEEVPGSAPNVPIIFLSVVYIPSVLSSAFHAPHHRDACTSALRLTRRLHEVLSHVGDPQNYLMPKFTHYAYIPSVLKNSSDRLTNLHTLSLGSSNTGPKILGRFNEIKGALQERGFLGNSSMWMLRSLLISMWAGMSIQVPGLNYLDGGINLDAKIFKGNPGLTASSSGKSTLPILLRVFFAEKFERECPRHDTTVAGGTRLLHVFFARALQDRVQSITPLTVSSVNPGFCYSSMRRSFYENQPEA
ncbi:hypothetical protein BU15DRAFT_66848 [Melanogaster broomeanus]|nr:hypothetical protein BU15DRAFT_66848 [Melanogaster broomeanus]